MKRKIVFCFLLILLLSSLPSFISCGNLKTGFSSSQKYIEDKTVNMEEKGVQGYDEEGRKKIYFELLGLEKNAEKEAITKYPTKQSDPNYAEGNYDKYKEYKLELMKKYREELATKYGITQDQMDAIRREGFQKDWSVADY